MASIKLKTVHMIDKACNHSKNKPNNDILAIVKAIDSEIIATTLYVFWHPIRLFGHNGNDVGDDDE